MFDLTEKDIKNMIKEYNEKVISLQDAEIEQKLGAYPINYVIECGLKYIYAEQHMGSGQIVECKNSFSNSLLSSIPHKCKGDFAVLEIKGLKTKCTAAMCKWTGNNLAIVTKDNELHAYYKQEFLFDYQLKGITAIDATSTKIYLGTDTGALIHFDPISRSHNLKLRHSAAITAVHCINNTILSCSEDGTVFYRKSLKISNESVLDVVCFEREHLCCYLF